MNLCAKSRLTIITEYISNPSERLWERLRRITYTVSLTSRCRKHWAAVRTMSAWIKLPKHVSFPPTSWTKLSLDIATSLSSTFSGSLLPLSRPNNFRRKWEIFVLLVPLTTLPWSCRSDCCSELSSMSTATPDAETVRQVLIPAANSVIVVSPDIFMCSGNFVIFSMAQHSKFVGLNGNNYSGCCKGPKNYE